MDNDDDVSSFDFFIDRDDSILLAALVVADDDNGVFMFYREREKNGVARIYRFSKIEKPMMKRGI